MLTVRVLLVKLWSSI